MSIETMTKLATVTVGVGGAANIDFSNIPQTYNDLLIVTNLRDTVAGVTNAGIRVIFNNDTSASYLTRYFFGNGTGGFSSSDTTSGWTRVGQQPGASATSNIFSNDHIYISNYSEPFFKSIVGDSVSENNGTEAYITSSSGLWSSTAPITNIRLQSNSSSWVQNSTATLYGIKNARKAAGNSVKAIGGNISFDGTYVYHTFNSSGTFTPTSPLTADYLVVAGGGGGGYQHGGGGGAGGLRCTVTATGGGGSLESKINLLPNNNYSVIVGAGGAASPNTGGSNNGAIASNGSNSDFATITSIGGGGGSSYRSATSQTAATGGSGGGGGSTTSGSLPNKGSGTANQGYAGGNGRVGDSPNIGGGGGGAGAVGGDASGNAGNGGAGITSIISGSSITYAGGGGGGSDGTVAAAGSGGSGGGGAGSKTTTAATSGTANTGGGGGGAGVIGGVGGAGGSGIVIIRYKG